MEAQVATADEHFLPGLEFRLPAAASSAISCTASTFFAMGGNQYSLTGVRLLRFQISDGHSFLDPSSLRLAYTIRNDAAQPLELIASPSLCLFQRLRISLNGQVVEDVNFLHRANQMFELLQPLGRRLRDAHLGWGTQDAAASESATSSQVALSGVLPCFLPPRWDDLPLRLDSGEGQRKTCDCGANGSCGTNTRA
jgi:hypothetical protein